MNTRTASLIGVTWGIIVGVFFILLLDRRWIPPVVISQEEVRPDVVKAGGQIEFMWSVYENRIGCSGTIERTLTSSDMRVYQYPPTNVVYRGPAVGPVSRKYKFVRRLDIPEGVSDGPARFTVVAHRWCNPVQHLWPITTPPSNFYFTIRS
jgi:hypothetical protein